MFKEITIRSKAEMNVCMPPPLTYLGFQTLDISVPSPLQYLGLQDIL